MSRPQPIATRTPTNAALLTYETEHGSKTIKGRVYDGVGQGLCLETDHGMVRVDLRRKRVEIVRPYLSPVNLGRFVELKVEAV